jgi:23S rRNA (cytidine1920-2'-O)/16S rRNA (cytidine1409-2'-O)-methyltransferase
LAGKVLVSEQKIVKAGTNVDSDAPVRLLGPDIRYVSRGGLKLEHALAHWKLDVGGFVALDIGASTGGFSDCLLQHGVSQVIAVDTGYGQLDFRLRQDPRLRLLEKTNARFLQAKDIGAPVDIVVVDVSFISATLVLPPVVGAAFPRPPSVSLAKRHIIVLVKPQFEAGREHVGKGGIVRDEDAQQASVEKVRRCVTDLGFTSVETIDSPILGAEGNREFLMHALY